MPACTRALPAGLRARFTIGSAHVAVLAVLVAAGLALTAWVTLHSAPQAVPVPVAHTSPAAMPTVPSGSPSSSTPSSASVPSSASSAGVSVVVDVAGKVRRPGIVTLPAGSRVIDALRRAGGVRGRVDLTALNLARRLTDGEQILVGQGVGPKSAAGGTASAAGAPSGPAAVVNLNTAGLEELDSLPGVGPVTAQKILDWRNDHGSFTTIDELLEVDGIGDKTMADIKPHVTL
jgi:competence protein ComEA